MSCRSCMKCVLTAINILTMLVGLVLMVAGILAIIKSRDHYPQLYNYNENLKMLSIVITVLGGILLFLGTLGCFGAITGKKGVLNFYFGLILIVLLVEIAAIVYGVIKRKEIEEEILDNIEEIFSKTNNTTATQMELIVVEYIQIYLKCCGFDDKGPFYWTKWNYNNKVPASCCGTTRADPNSAAYYCDRYDPKIRKRGCSDVLHKYWKTYVSWGVIGTLGFFVLMNMWCMYGAFRLKKRYYEDDDYTYTRYSDPDLGTTKTTGFNTTWL